MKYFGGNLFLLICFLFSSCQQIPESLTPSPTVRDTLPSLSPTPAIPFIELLTKPAESVLDFSHLVPITADNAASLELLFGITQDIIYQVAWSPDGKFIAAATSHGLKLYSSNSLKEKSVDLSPYLARSSLVVFSATGTMLAWTEIQSGGEAGLWLWNLVNGKKNFISMPTTDLTDLVFSRNGQLIASAIYNEGIHVWQVDNGKLVASMISAGGASEVTFSPDGKLLASAGHHDLMAHLWNADTGEEIGTVGNLSTPVTKVTFQPNSSILALGSTGAVQLWDINAGIEVQNSRIANDAFLSELVFDASGDFLAIPVYSESKVHILNSALGKVAEVEVGPYVRSVSFSPDGKFLAVVSSSGLKIFATSTWELRDFRPPPLGTIEQMVFRPDKQALVSIHEGSVTIAWDLQTGAEISRISSPGKHFLSPDGKLLAIGAESGGVSVWDVDTGKMLKSYQRASKWGVSEITFSQDNHLLTISYPDTAMSVAFWEWETNQEPKVYTLDEGLGYIGTLTSDEHKLAVQIWENEIWTNVGVWDTQTHDLLWTSSRGDAAWISSAAFDPGNEILAVGDRWNGAISLYDIKSRGLLETFNQPSEPLDYDVAVNDILFSHNGKLLATIIKGDPILWNLETSTAINFEPGCIRAIESIAFSQDDTFFMMSGGQNLTTNNGGGGVCIWEPQTGRLLAGLSGDNSGKSNFATFNPDKTLLAMDDNGTIWLWGIP